MKTRVAVFAWSAALASACAAPMENEEPATKEATEVAATAPSLRADCPSAFLRELNNLAFFASTAASDAAGNYAPDDELALDFFGKGHNSDAVLSTLWKIAEIGGSDQIVFSCDPSQANDGT